MSNSRYSTSTSNHQILSPSFSSDLVNQKSPSNSKEIESNEEIELYKAIKASEDQFRLENQLKVEELNEIEKAIKISKSNHDEYLLPTINPDQQYSTRPSRLPPGASYPIEKDYLIEDELLSIAIKLSLQERDHWNSKQHIQDSVPPPLPYRANRDVGPGQRKVPDIPNRNQSQALPASIPPPLPPRNKLIHHKDSDHFHHHHQDLSDGFSDNVSLDSDDESNSFDDLSIHSSHYTTLDSTTNLLNPRSFVREDDNHTEGLNNYQSHSNPIINLSNVENGVQELSFDEEKNQTFFPTRQSSIQGSFVTALDELDRDSTLENDSVHQASSFISKKDQRNRLPIYQKPKIPNRFLGSSDTIHQSQVDGQGSGTPNASLNSSDTIHQIPPDDQEPEIPNEITRSFHSIHELGIDDQQTRIPNEITSPSHSIHQHESEDRAPATSNRVVDPSDLIHELEPNDEECRTPKVDSSNPIDPIHELENNSNENLESQSNEPLEDLMNSIQSIAKINYIESSQDGNGVECEEIRLGSDDHEVLKVSSKKSIWIETKTCSDLLKWLMWWGEIKIENEEIGKSKGNSRGMIKIKLNFKIKELQSGSTSTKPNEEEAQSQSRLTCKIEILKDLKNKTPLNHQSKPNETLVIKGKKKSQRQEEKEYEYLIEDPFMIPCRFSNIVIRLFTLVQLSNLANLTKLTNPKKVNNSNFFELKKLGEFIQRLEDKKLVGDANGNANANANGNGNGLIERLRDRLKRLKKVDLGDQCGSNTDSRMGNSTSTGRYPLEVGDRNLHNGIDDQDRIRWLPIL